MSEGSIDLQHLEFCYERLSKFTLKFTVSWNEKTVLRCNSNCIEIHLKCISQLEIKKNSFELVMRFNSVSILCGASLLSQGGSPFDPYYSPGLNYVGFVNSMFVNRELELFGSVMKTIMHSLMCICRCSVVKGYACWSLVWIHCRCKVMFVICQKKFCRMLCREFHL